MPALWLTVGGLWIFILATEAILWLLFVRNIRPMLLPQELDESSHGFFTMTRARVCMLLHTVFLLASVTSFLLWIW